jgi:PTH1 family peptidyl-tRNA hydrolase
MKIIFAQGNPGADFAYSRHNVGFMVLDYISKQQNLPWQEKPRFSSLISETTLGDEKVLFAKPTTFYNDTGTAARALIDFYKIDQAHDFLVVHDDFALPFGMIRIREKGSDAGNNGIKSLNSHLGENYHRMRIGIWNERRNQVDDVDFVLHKFLASEQEDLATLVFPKSFQLVKNFIDDNLQITSHKLI